MIAQSILARLEEPRPVESSRGKSAENFRAQTLYLSPEEFRALDILHMAAWGDFVVCVRSKSLSDDGRCWASFCFYRRVADAA